MTMLELLELLAMPQAEWVLLPVDMGRRTRFMLDCASNDRLPDLDDLIILVIRSCIDLVMEVTMTWMSS